MAIQRVHQSTFHRGEIDPKLLGRVDLVAYGQALKKARNITCLNQGGFERRPGSLYLADLGETTRLESFIFSADQKYILAFQNTKLKIYSVAGSLLQTISSCRWTTSQLFELNMTQQGDVVIITHKDMEYYKLTRTGATTFSLADFSYDERSDSKRIFQPYFKFAPNTMTLDIDTTTAGTGVTCTTSAAYFTSDYVGAVIRYHGFELLITGYTSSTVVTATLKENVAIELIDDPFEFTEGSREVKVTMVSHGFATNDSITIAGANTSSGVTDTALNDTHTITVLDEDNFIFTYGPTHALATDSNTGGGVRVQLIAHPPTLSWDEQLYSDAKGYPAACIFHEQRLFLAGSDEAPDLLVGSKVSQFFNFDEGTAQDNESVQIQIASNEINQIRHLVSEKQLQIFTNQSEFYLRQQISKPITPSDISIVRESTMGSQQKAMPRVFDGATIYVQNNGKNVREYVYNQSTEILESNNISIEASSLIRNPTDSCVLRSQSRRTEQFYVLVNGDDGTLAFYSGQRDQKILGWFLYETNGEYISAASTNDYIYVATKRTVNSADVYSLEQIALDPFDLPTDYTVSKTLSGSYQPHGSPLTNGAISSKATFIADGFTNAPSQGEAFQFGGSGTVYNITSATATGVSGEYVITIDAAVSQSDGVTLIFTKSKVFNGLNSAPDMRGLTVHATSGSTETDDYFYYGSGTVDTNGVVNFPNAAAACDIGLDYTVDVETLPQDANIQNGQLTGYPRKIGKSIVEIHNSFNLQVNSLDVLLQDRIQDSSSGMQKFTGKKEVHTLGYSTEPFLTIKQTVPLPFRILAITTEVYF